jgi:hypothetical protein
VIRIARTSTPVLAKVFTPDELPADRPIINPKFFWREDLRRSRQSFHSEQHPSLAAKVGAPENRGDGLSP